MKKIIISAFITFFCMITLSAQDIELPQPIRTGGMPLMEALNNRSSCREFSTEEIDMQTLSNLLWAAWGYNRPDKRTAPSSMNKQELSLYVVMKSGAYLYDAKANKLIQVNNQDVRMATAKQDYVKDAPINIVFVSDKTKDGDSKTNSGFISQNIYLFCASEGLGTVVRGYFDANEVSKALNLKETQVPVLCQTVGKKKN